MLGNLPILISHYPLEHKKGLLYMYKNFHQVVQNPLLQIYLFLIFYTHWLRLLQLFLLFPIGFQLLRN